ncbi:C-type lectin domain family 4 member E-like [Carassius auratus]|uniref:C-type lectin domain family 4 member E-like n=1 Tax=Carassius auratus TaxID=7957 RepID=A0A6P6PB03_CARAU|nr:C-type lectin domain family 4 member E-like [Carassius auratus]
MEMDDVYENVKDTSGLQKQNHKKCRGSRCLVSITVGFGLICVLLLIFVILQHIRVLSFSDKQGLLFMSTDGKNWSESRQYCRDRGADLVIINTEEKQRFISSFATESVWIGLSDTEDEGIMKWVDNSPLKQGFWDENEPNDLGGTEDCVVLNPGRPIMNNWNDLSCSYTIHFICEK